jgi:hypothetical protein
VKALVAYLAAIVVRVPIGGAVASPAATTIASTAPAASAIPGREGRGKMRVRCHPRERKGEGGLIGPGPELLHHLGSLKNWCSPSALVSFVFRHYKKMQPRSGWVPASLALW